jgi:phosphatidylglycerophosphatase A
MCIFNVFFVIQNIFFTCQPISNNLPKISEILIMHKLLTSFFGLGLLPFAPGTWGSLAPAVIYMATGIVFGHNAMMWSMTILLIVSTVITIACSPKVIALTGSQDPGRIVSDEVAGQSLTFILAGLIMPITVFCTATAVGFGLFRLFDIVKLWPCKRLEKLPAGWGILADDLAAGIQAAVVWVIMRKLGLPL